MMTISMAKSSKHTHGLENRMLDSSVADEMTGLTLKRWEKKLEQEPKRVEGDSEDPHLRPGNEGRPDWSALRRKKEFPQSTFQHLLEEVSQAQGNGCQQRRSPPPPPRASTCVSLPPPGLEPPGIIQHSVPQPLATITKQLPQQPLTS